jgi:hypothetical protein
MPWVSAIDDTTCGKLKKYVKLFPTKSTLIAFLSLVWAREVYNGDNAITTIHTTLIYLFIK